MVNLNGTVTINYLSDRDLRKVLDIKIKYEKALNFNPANMQQVNQGGAIVYNNAILNWTDEAGLEAVRELLAALKQSEEKAAVVR